MTIRPFYLVLPRPISTNSLHRNVPGVGRVDTSDYRKWKILAAQHLQAQTPLPRIASPVELTFFLGEIGVGDMDADNTAKAMQDVLVEHKIIIDDNRTRVRSVRCVWVPGMKGAVVEIMPARPAPPPSALVQRVGRAVQDLLR